MICDYGMDDAIGLITIHPSDVIGSEYYAQIIRRTSELLNEQFSLAKEILSKNRAGIDALTEALLAKNSLKEKEIDEILCKTAIR